MPAVEHDPYDQPRHDGDGGDIGAQDETGVRAEIHRHAPAAASACISSMVRRRRRTISLRMAARCSVRNNKVNATSMTISGIRIVGSMVDPPSRSTDADWCSVFHHSTENLMMGMLIAPTSVSTATTRAARLGSSIVRQSAMTPRYIRNSTSTDVSLASQTQ